MASPVAVRPHVRGLGLILALSLVAAACGGSPTGGSPGGDSDFLTGQDILFLPPLEPDRVSFYGPGEQEFGHLRLPEGPGPHPVVVVIHGGCWVWAVSLRYMDRFAAALTERGVATWNLEYTRVGSPEAGWPRPFLDIALGIDHLRILAPEHDLDLDRVAVAGHSAGGLLALWSAGRSNIDPDSPLHAPGGLPVVGAVGLGAAGDLAALWRQQGLGCGLFPLEEIMEGGPEDVPERYAAASPAALLPTGSAFRLITGARDDIFPPFAAQDFAIQASAAGDDTELKILSDAAHYEPIAPWTPVWPEVEASILALLGIEVR